MFDLRQNIEKEKFKTMSLKLKQEKINELTDEASVTEAEKFLGISPFQDKKE